LAQVGPTIVSVECMNFKREWGFWATDVQHKLAEVQALGVNPQPPGAVEDVTIRVNCQRTGAGSVSHVFHTTVPTGADVACLRAKLGNENLPRTGEVLARRPAVGLVSLPDEEALPLEVTVSNFTGTVVPMMLLTTAQCIEAHSMLISILQKADFQRKLHAIEEQVGGNMVKFRLRVNGVLMTEVYPDVCRHFGLDARFGAGSMAKCFYGHSVYEPSLAATGEELIRLMRISDAGFPQEPISVTKAPVKALASSDADQTTWLGTWLLQSAVRNGEMLWDAEARLSASLQAADMVTPKARHEQHAKRAAVRLELGLYDAALVDAIAAEDAKGANAAYVAAKAGLQQFSMPSDTSLFGNTRIVRHLRRLEGWSKGDVDFSDFFWNTSVPTLMPPVGEYIGPVEVRLAKDGRRGLYATRVLKAGEFLLCSSALLRMMRDSGKPMSGRSPDSLAAAVDIYSRAARVSAHVAHILGGVLSDGSSRPVVPMEQLMWRGAPGGDPFVPNDAVVHGACAVNAFADLGESLFPAISMANHSCSPNAFVLKMGEAFVLRTQRFVRADEEVTISYFNVMAPLGEREARCKAWSFICDCARCTVEREVPTCELALPLSILHQIVRQQRLDTFIVGDLASSAVHELVKRVRQWLGDDKPEDALRVYAGYAGLYEGRVQACEEEDKQEAWLDLLELYEFTNPSSFVNCKLTLNHWRWRSGQFGNGDGTYLCSKVRAPGAWRLCVRAHLLRYGNLDGDYFLRLLEETRRSIDEDLEEFSDRQSERLVRKQ